MRKGDGGLSELCAVNYGFFYGLSLGQGFFAGDTRVVNVLHVDLQMLPAISSSELLRTRKSQSHVACLPFVFPAVGVFVLNYSKELRRGSLTSLRKLSVSV